MVGCYKGSLKASLVRDTCVRLLLVGPLFVADEFGCVVSNQLQRREVIKNGTQKEWLVT